MPKKTTNLPVPSKTDLEILSVLWDKGQATGREIYDALTALGVLRHTIAYTTVKTYLDRLVHKGYATAKVLSDSRGTHLYTAKVSRQDVRDHTGLLDRLVRALGLRPPEYALWFYQQGRLSSKDKKELERILRTISDKDLPDE